MRPMSKPLFRYKVVITRGEGSHLVERLLDCLTKGYCLSGEQLITESGHGLVPRITWEETDEEGTLLIHLVGTDEQRRRWVRRGFKVEDEG